jgi:hypothetical protein
LAYRELQNRQTVAEQSQKKTSVDLDNEDVWTVWIINKPNALEHKHDSEYSIMLHILPNSELSKLPPTLLEDETRVRRKRDIWPCLSRRTTEEWHVLRKACLAGKVVGCLVVDAGRTMQLEAELRALHKVSWSERVRRRVSGVKETHLEKRVEVRLCVVGAEVEDITATQARLVTRMPVPPQRVVAPPQRVVAPPQRVVAPPQRVVAPSERVTAPPRKVASPPQRTAAPSRRMVAPRERVVANLHKGATNYSARTLKTATIVREEVEAREPKRDVVLDASQDRDREREKTLALLEGRGYVYGELDKDGVVSWWLQSET